jgi:tetratricopeptide (TPR) repeat protein
MQRKSFEEYKDLFLQARASNNWNDVVLWSTELIHYKDDLAYVWANRGVGLSRLGHPLDAVLNYERALKLENENEQRAILYSNIGAAYWDMMNASKAIDHLNQALWINPLAQTYLTLGNIYKYQSDLPKAIEAYRNSIFADPTYVDGHMVLGHGTAQGR